MEKEKIMEIQKELQNAMGESGEVKFTTMQKVGGMENIWLQKQINTVMIMLM